MVCMCDGVHVCMCDGVHVVMYTQEFGLEHDTHVPVEFRIMEFHLDLLPLDSDVLSLDMPSAFTVSCCVNSLVRK